MTADRTATSRSVDEPIDPAERSGMLRPVNLERYAAARFQPATPVAHVVDQYWHVRWTLGTGEALTQRIIDMPLITLTIERGNVPAHLVITGVQSGAWQRTIAGQGSVFAIRLRPAGLAALSDLSPADVADATIPVTPSLDAGLHELLSLVARAPSPDARAARANRAIEARTDGLTMSAEQTLANQVFDVLTGDVRARVGVDLAAELGTGERSLQRALKATVGRGPKWITRRIRLQEVARRLATEPTVDLTALALDLGYADQAHLTNDFTAVAGVSPDAYRRSLAES